MKSYIVKIPHLGWAHFMCFIILFLIIGSLSAVSREDNDLYFIISLYEHQQYDLAGKQIILFEKEYPTSEKVLTTTFIKAGIALTRRNYQLADSLYTALLAEKLDTSMLIDCLINKGEIEYFHNSQASALSYLDRAEGMATDTAQIYKLSLIKGKVYARQLNYDAALIYLEKALQQKPSDPAATNELVSVYLASGQEDKAQGLIQKILSGKSDLDANTNAIDTWLDYLLSEEDFIRITELKNTLEQSGRQYSDTIRLRFAKAMYLQKDYTAANSLVQACTKYAGYKSFMTGLILIGQGNVSEADSIFAKLAQGNLKADDYLPDSKSDLVIDSWLERIKILYNTEPEQALAYLSRYVTAHENDPNPYVLYVYGSLLFKDKDYQNAIITLLKVRQLAVTPELNHDILIMLGDIWFNAKLPDNALQSYNNYLNLYPGGRFRTHALYNMALIYYDLKAFPEAAARLNTIFNEETDPEMIAKARFLLAEINFYQSNYDLARTIYTDLDSTYLNRLNLDFRIAQCFYYAGDYQAAADCIPNLIYDSTNAFQILMLEGNIYFNLNRYDQALQIYNSSASYAKTDSEQQEVDSYVALTLYRLQRFTEASSLYLKLSTEEASPSAFLLMAAKASYHSKDYQQALILFKQFIQDYPDDANYNYALANLGSIYYNQGDYRRAIPLWIDLLQRYKTNQSFTDDEQIILSGIFSGLQWALKQQADEQFLTQINDMIDSFSSEYIKFELQYLLLKIYYGSEQWSDILQMADNLRAEFPQHENNEIRRYVAQSLAGLDRTAEADSVYKQIFSLEPTPDILNEWADMEIKAGNYPSALQKLDQAVSLDKNPDRWQRLLSASFDYLPDSLGIYWHRWSPEFDSIPDQAGFIWLKWNFRRGNWPVADSLARTMVLNPDYQIRSTAQFILGEALFNMKQDDDAITELYRGIYLYPESADLVLEAKTYIIRAYSSLGQYPEAASVYSEITDSLTPEQQAELEPLTHSGQD